MDLKAFADGIKSGALIKNTVADTTSSLIAKIEGLPLETQALLENTKQTLLAQNAASQELIASLPTKLPLLKAADEINNKTKITQGIIPAANGSDAFKNTFSVLTESANQSQKLNETLSTQLDTLKTPISPETPLNLEAIFQISSSTNAFAEKMNQSTAASNAAASAAIGDLKAFAFAKFCSMPQPPHVQEVISKVVPQETIPSTVTVKLDEQTSQTILQKRYTEAYIPSKPTPTKIEEPKAPPKVTSTSDRSIDTINGKPFVQFKNEYFSYIEQAEAKRAEALKSSNAKLAEAQQYRDTTWPNYQQVKEQASKDKESQAKYFQMRDSFKNSQPYIDAENERLKWVEADNEVKRLSNQWLTWTSQEYANVPAGPPW